MKFLDRFRPQEEWKNGDPAIRAAAVRKLLGGDEAQEQLTEIARHDDDPSVRCEAVVRIEDVETIVSIISNDIDTAVRAKAQGVLRELVIEAEDAAIGELGLSGLSDERDLETVARLARLESVSLLALSRLKDPHAIGAVARRAKRNKIAQEALSRIDDPTEILAVAVKAENKAMALQSFERLTAGHLTRDVLEQLGKRAKHKALRRQALVSLSALDKASVQPEPSREHVAVCKALEGMAAEGDLDRGREILDGLLRQWSALDETREVLMTERFTRARVVAEVRLSGLEATLEAERRVDQRRSKAVTDREALCRRVESLRDEVPADTLEQLREDLAVLSAAAKTALGSSADESPMGEALAALDQRFERAIAACEDRSQRQCEFRLGLTELGQIIVEMEKCVETNDVASGRQLPELARALDQVLGHRRDQPWQGFGSHCERDQMDELSALRQRYEVVQERSRVKAVEARAERKRVERVKLARLLQQCRTVEVLIASDKLSLAEAEHHLQAIRRLLDNQGLLPRRELGSVTRKLRHAHAGLVGRVRELRDFADWQRWANLGIQESQCRRMEALVEVSAGDDAALANTFLAIMERWRQASDVPKDRGAVLSERFKTAYDAVYPRCQTYFEARDADRKRNIARQRAMVEEVERLASSTDWIKTLRRVTALQAEWRSAGPFPRKEQKELCKRFQTACNAFFTRRRADLVERKKEWSRNLALKEALCERMEALVDGRGQTWASAEVKRAQAEWRTIGPVRRNRSDAVWERFCSACNQVFKRVHAAERAAAAKRAAVRETLCVELETWLPKAMPSQPGDDLATKIRDLQRRWRAAPPAVNRGLKARFWLGIAQLVEAYPDVFRGTDLDPVHKLKRLEKLCERVESIIPTEALGQVGASPAETLAARWREALASNTMGVRLDQTAQRRSAVEEVKGAMADWRRLGSVTGGDGSRLETRFHAACDHVLHWAQGKEVRRHRNSSPSATEPVLSRSGH